jgi:membrane protein
MAYLRGREFGRVIHCAVYEWYEDKAPRMAAAVAFYAVFSLTPIVVIAYQAAGMAFGTQVALREILGQAALLIGQQGADGIRLLIENAPPREGDLLSTALGLGIMVFAATGVFTELKDALNTIWEVQPKPGLSLLALVKDRVFAFAMVLVIWLLMLLSLIMSAAIGGASRLIPVEEGVLQFAEALISLLLTTVLFALIYRVLPDVHVAWRDVWSGAAVTATLFAAGKQLFGIYLGHSTIGSSYGAASSLIIIILWIYCSCLILLFGAEMSQVHAKLRHATIVPSPTAVHVTEHDRIQQGIPRTDEIERAARSASHDVTRVSGLRADPGSRTNTPRVLVTALSIGLFAAIWFFRPGRQ